MECFESIIVCVFGEKKPIETVYVSDKEHFKNNNVYGSSLRKWEAFVRDEKEIKYVAQLLEYKAGFSIDAVEHIEYMCRFDCAPFYVEYRTLSKEESRKKYLPLFLKALFERYATKHQMRTSEAIEKWLPIFEKVYGSDRCACLRDVYDNIEWEWED